MAELRYFKTNIKPLFYRDAFIVYQDIIKNAIIDNSLPPEIVQIVNNDLINVSRAPLIVIRRVDSPQGPSINHINEKVVNLGKDIVTGSSTYDINMAIFSYGNTYLEAERLGSIVQETLITTSINKVRKISDNKIIGHMLLGWSGTDYLQNNSKLMFNRVDIRIQMLLEYSVDI